MATGCRRVNIGTAALEQPEWCAAAIAEHGDRVAVGLDVRGRTLAARGWTEEGGDLYDVLARLDARGLRALRRHRRQQGRHAPGPEPRPAPRRVRRHRPAVVASGGITELTDLEALTALVPEGVEGAIIGTALYEGRFTLEDALPDPRRTPMTPRRPGDPVPGRRRRAGGQGHQLPATCATPATRSSWPRSTTRRAPTS